MLENFQQIFVFFLVAVIVALVYKDRILIWLYSHPTIRKFFPIDLEDEDKKFDAFISYAQQDSDFVTDVLLPGLEDNADIRFRCIVHIRDFVPGREITEQIMDAVNNSRRTVIVLSKHFVESEWAKLEFEAAHSKKKVILVSICHKTF
jgi:protein toll